MDVEFSHTVRSSYQHQNRTIGLVSLTIVRGVDRTDKFHILTV